VGAEQQAQTYKNKIKQVVKYKDPYTPISSLASICPNHN